MSLSHTNPITDVALSSITDGQLANVTATGSNASLLNIVVQRHGNSLVKVNGLVGEAIPSFFSTPPADAADYRCDVLESGDELLVS